jgi:hypothetical protein
MMKGFNPGNIGQLMKQARKMQEDMAKAQAELENETVTASSGGGMVQVVMTGKKVLQKLTLKKEVVDDGDIEMLEDLIVVAINEANKKVDELADSKMGNTGLPSGLGF